VNVLVSYIRATILRVEIQVRVGSPSREFKRNPKLCTVSVGNTHLILESLTDNFPVHHRPNSLEVVSLNILILQLASTQNPKRILEGSRHVPKHRHQVRPFHPSQDLDSILNSGRKGTVYGCGDDSQFTIFLDEPSPSTSLDSCEGTIECGLELIQGPVFRCERIFQGTGRVHKGFRRSQILPEKLV